MDEGKSVQIVVKNDEITAQVKYELRIYGALNVTY